MPKVGADLAELSKLVSRLNGFRDERASGFLEERIDRHGLHHFTLRTTDQAVATVATLADPGDQAGWARTSRWAAQGAAGEIPADVTDALRELRPGVTRLDAYHSRPAGTRRMQASILVQPGSVRVVRSAFGVAPEHPRLAAVNRDALRQVVRDLLADPAGDPGSDMSTRDAIGGQRRPSYRCPVCGFPGLAEPARTEALGGSFEVCPCCGFQFGVSDDNRSYSYEQWRDEWIAGGMTWWSRGPRPADWDPRRQLRELAGS